jgi:hypothetical protein
MKLNRITQYTISGLPILGSNGCKFLLRGMVFFLILSLIASCKKYLDVVPDNVPTIDNAFASKVEAEKYLYTCYSYIPSHADPQVNPGSIAGDEFWSTYPVAYFNPTVWNIARGQQNSLSPYANYWDGGNGIGRSYYVAIRDCNVFLENISDVNKVPDLQLDLRIRWIGEVQFLKAFYHFLLFRAYGPIPITDKNLSVDAPIEELKVKRQPVDSVVNYIVNLLDTAAIKLPYSIKNQTSELGRITRSIALSLKAKVLTTAASPLYNGNPDYSSFINKDGVNLFSQVYSAAKWERAAIACKEAIDFCESQGIKLYNFNVDGKYIGSLTDTTETQLSIRNAACERWNPELIWGLVTNNSTYELQTMAYSFYDPNGGVADFRIGGPTLNMAKLFYTKNGVPLKEDKTLDFSDITKTRPATSDERFNLIENYETSILNFDREPRFYADLAFDGGINFMENSPTKSDEGTWFTKNRFNAYSAPSGYYAKKMLNWKFTSEDRTFEYYPWPELRMADLYLLYAEALNEAQGPVAGVHEYIDKVRHRAGLPSVKDSWDNFSNNPSKYQTKDGMRTIIQQERSIELMFEGQRYWDLLRWKTAGQVLNQNITGWYIRGETVEDYYREITLFSQKFSIPRDYLWPIQNNDLLINENLVQNPNW